jgi:uncharacterized UBP type Zn finger protein
VENTPSKELQPKKSFLGGITRKTARTEDDVVARAAHFSKVDNGDKAGGKEHVAKLKYNEADVKRITKMGFTRDQAVQALIENHHNVEGAVNSLTHGYN